MTDVALLSIMVVDFLILEIPKEQPTGRKLALLVAIIPGSTLLILDQTILVPKRNIIFQEYYS